MQQSEGSAVVVGLVGGFAATTVRRLGRLVDMSRTPTSTRGWAPRWLKSWEIAPSSLTRM